MKIKQEILNILEECTIEGNLLFLPPRQLDRKTYEAVNKCLTSLGGKWNRKSKAHAFDSDPSEAFDNLLMTGETEDMKKHFQFFPTPRDISAFMCEYAELDASHNVLEPSCGRGDLADVIYERCKNLSCIELNTEMSRHLDKKPYSCKYMDFLSMDAETSGRYDRIIMNPPFSKQQDIRHVMHAYRLLASGGVLVSVISTAPFWRTSKLALEFRDWFEENHGESVPVDEGVFKESGTMIPTYIIKVKKPLA